MANGTVDEADMAQAAHQPTDDQRSLVKWASGFGIPHSEIAKRIGISEPTLRKYYRDELDFGSFDADMAVLQSLWKKATGDGPMAVSAAIWWTKVRRGWREPKECTPDADGELKVRIEGGLPNGDGE